MRDIEKRAQFWSRMSGFTIASVLLAELGIIGVGTYSTLSWDIMEPISYVMSLVNFSAGFGWYYLHIRN